MSIELKRLFKFYDGHCVVNNVTLKVDDGELFVLLGPSGSGKSTVLRMIAGLSAVDGGRVFLNERDVTTLRPQRRGVGLVFQQYALFPRMTVAENVEFALRIRGVRVDERRARCNELLELVGLVGFEKRSPDQLSGGQQQRVAIARALAHRPDVLLFDEPFGALDAKIRAGLRRSIRDVQRKLGIATIFVTHDQEEALELADRVGVMNFGRILEVGRPRELYFRPQTEFVATFLGRANLLIGECDGTGVRLGQVRLPLDGQVKSTGVPRRVQVLFRPEDVAVKDSPGALGWPLLGKGVVQEVTFSGSVETLRLRLPTLAGTRCIAPEPPFGADYILVDAMRSQHQARRFPLSPGSFAWVGVRRIHALPHSGLSLLLVAEGNGDDSVLRVGTELARQLHARWAVLAPGEDLLHEAGTHSFDLVVRGRPSRKLTETAESILCAGDHHLLVLPREAGVPKRMLVCVNVGEPGKEDVFFAGRLARHLGTSATILSVRPLRCSVEKLEQGERFLEAGARTRSLFGVETRPVMRRGDVVAEILAETERGGHDLVVLGAAQIGSQVRLSDMLRRLLHELSTVTVLVIQPRIYQVRGRTVDDHEAAVGFV